MIIFKKNSINIDFIEDAKREDKEKHSLLDDFKDKVIAWYAEYFSQSVLAMFFDIYGLGAFVTHCLLILFYVLFSFFFMEAFYFPYTYGFLLATLIILLGIILIIKQYKIKLSDYFEDRFSFSLRMISRNLGAGKTILGAIESTSKHTSGRLKNEFNRICKQVHAGNTLDEALQQGELIYPFKGYIVFSANVQLSLRSGGSIKDLLNELAVDLQGSQIIRRKTLALTSESRGAAKILAALPIFMLLILNAFAPENLAYLFTQHYGQIVLVYVVISVTLGFIVIKRMIDNIAL